jgi:ATP-dependent DNA ligase
MAADPWAGSGIAPGYEPMEARLAAALPDGPGWQYEPKWDGFRFLAFRAGDAIDLRSKSGKSLGRFFPEVVARLAAIAADRFVLDGELIIPLGGRLAFDALQARLHPAESRIRKLAAETPADCMLFDMLVDTDGTVLADRPLARRRDALARFHARHGAAGLLLSPCTAAHGQAAEWLAAAGGALDGVVAKRADGRYAPGERAMIKVKQHRTADCVVGGFRYGADSRLVGSLLLGLYDDSGRLDHVGFTSGIADSDRADLTARLEAVAGGEGFTGRAPGGPSRWSTERSAEWQPLHPELVVEVGYDQVTADRFRHGTRLIRWRPDKAARQCRMDQLAHELAPAELASALGLGPAAAAVSPPAGANPGRGGGEAR